MPMLSNISHAVEFIVLPLAIAPLVGAAAISGITALLGANKQSKAANNAGSIQERLARESLAEQRRIYEEERDREERDRQEERDREDRDRERTDEENFRIRDARSNAFGGFGADLANLSKGYAPAYGMSKEQTDSLLNERNSRFPPMPPLPPRGQLRSGPAGPGPMIYGNGGGPETPPGGGPPVGPPAVGGGMSGGGGRSSSLSTTVWLRAPTGEEMEVPIEEAPDLINQGAILIPPPGGEF